MTGGHRFSPWHDASGWHLGWRRGRTGRLLLCAACRRHAALFPEGTREPFFCADCLARAAPARLDDPYDDLGGGD